MKDLIAKAYYYRYPQRCWAIEIATALRITKTLHPSSTILDAPCGDGIVSYWLAKSFINNRFELYDLEVDKVTRARTLCSGLPNVSVAQEDLRQVNLPGAGPRIWLLINSLFLFSEVSEFLEGVFNTGNIETVVGVFPYTDRPNYLAFRKRYPDCHNPSNLDIEETRLLFSDWGFEEVFLKDCTRFAFHRLPRPIRMVTHPLLIGLEGECNGGSYWTSVFCKRK